MQAPTLTTERLLLVHPSGVHECLYTSFYTDAHASHAYGGPISASAAIARLSSDSESWSVSGFGVWVVQLREQQEPVGACGFWQGKGWPRELTWWLMPSARGKGLAQEASRAAVAHAYEVFQWSSVETYMNDANEAARALVLRLGGKKSRRELFLDGLERDVYCIPSPD